MVKIFKIDKKIDFMQFLRKKSLEKIQILSKNQFSTKLIKNNYFLTKLGSLVKNHQDFCHFLEIYCIEKKLKIFFVTIFQKYDLKNFKKFKKDQNHAFT